MATDLSTDTSGATTVGEQEAGVRYPSGCDPEGPVARSFGVVGLPTTVLVDGRGGTVAHSLGEVTDDEWLELGEEAFGMDVERSRS